MDKLEQSVKHSSRLLLVTFLSIIVSILFIFFFSFLLAYSKRMADHKIILITLGTLTLEVQLLLTIYSLIFYFLPSKEQSSNLRERSKFTCIWTMYIGFIFITPLISLRSYILSGGNKKYIKKAKKEYEETKAIALTEFAINNNQIKLSKNTLIKIDNVRQLASENFITLDEKSSYLWEILNEQTTLLKDKIDYNDPKVIKQVSDILETL